MNEEMKLWLAIIGTTVAKWLLTDEGPGKDETPAMASVRRRKAFGGIIAGVLISYYGHGAVIRWVPALTDQDRLIVAIVLALSGEHFMRWVIGTGPELFSKIADRLIGGGK